MASNKDKTDTGGPETRKTASENRDRNDAMAQGFAAFAQFSKTILEASTPDIMGTGGPASQNETENPDPLGLGADFSKVFEHMARNPEAILQAQSALWQSYGALWSQTLARAAGKPSEDVVSPAPGDRRWQDPEWSENLMFDLIKQSYLLSANWLNDIIANVEGIEPQTRDKISFFTKQMTDAFAPTNFAMTNPEVLRATAQSKGQNIKKGMENFARDLQDGDGKLKIRQTDTDAFEIGKTIATTPGKVVFENEIMQLLQFSPTTNTVFKRPLVIFPPWINKYYILDLRPEQSMIRWLVDKGYCVFVVSWVNPDCALKDKAFEDYMQDGIFAALNAIKAATGEARINAVGYCIGGTLLAATLAYMATKNDRRIATATFFAAQSDFSEAGDLRIFCDEAGLVEIERRMDESGGILDGASMSEAFNLLRPNDLIWSPVISNYMLGQDPRPFDLLYWNADATRMPKALHLQYLRIFYQKNAFSKGEMVLAGVKLDPASITLPLYIQSSREDHIAPAASVYRSAKLYGSAASGKVRFIMSGSGHIAGVINPPAAKKYQYWTNTALPADMDSWKAGAKEHVGSWWPDWHNWLKTKSGKKVSARTPGDGDLPIIEDAPGRYVKVKS